MCYIVFQILASQAVCTRHVTLKNKVPATLEEEQIILAPALFVVKYILVKLVLEHTQG